MARNEVLQQSLLPYHVTARTVNKEPFELPMPEVWEIFQDHLHFVHHAFGFRTHSFVLMNNHFHMLVQTPDANLGRGMAWLMREVAREINRRCGRINQVWGGRFFRSIIESDHYLRNVYKYVYYNPVKAGASKLVEEYPYSSLRSLLGLDYQIAPFHDEIASLRFFQNTLSWLNTPPREKDWVSTQRAIRRSRFKYCKELGTNRINPLETQLL